MTAALEAARMMAALVVSASARSLIGVPPVCDARPTTSIVKRVLPEMTSTTPIGIPASVLNILVWLAMVFFGLGAQLLELNRHASWSTRAKAHDPPSTPAAQPLVAGEPPRQPQ